MNIEQIDFKNQQLKDNAFKREKDEIFETLLTDSLDEQSNNEADSRLKENFSFIDVKQVDNIRASSNINQIFNVDSKVSNTKNELGLLTKNLQLSNNVENINFIQNVKYNQYNTEVRASKSNVALTNNQLSEPKLAVFKNLLFVKKENKLFINNKDYEVIERNGKGLINILREFGVKITKLIVSGKQIQEK